MKRRPGLEKAKIKLLLASLLLNAFILTTFNLITKGITSEYLEGGF
jgi:hypothetical protein